MNLMINTVHDLIHILNTRPEWRRQVKQALFPGVDLEKALKELAEAQQRTENALARNEELIRLLIDAQFKAEKRLDKVDKRLDKVDIVLANHTKRLARLENKMTEASVERQAMTERLDKIEQNQEVFKGDMEELKRNQRDLKGKGYETDFTNKADAIFGYYLRRGRSVRNEVGDHLEEPEDNGLVSEQESKQVFATDLLWGGKLKSSKQQVILAIEVSWLAEKHDVERALARANILRRIGLQALPVVAGVKWVDGLKEEALREGVVIVNDKQLDSASWHAALAKMS